ncbi:MAG TPA: alpha-1,2-fucosyltransferase [Candidatus Paceibacterota bacterium]|nr:alpha-1,2-fucosyltransferase [Candidatus Paceibacterota bacterium]
MIITRISGGIGNQLFQYAVGRALSLKNNTELKLDTHFYGLNIEPDRSFKLSHFNIPNIEALIATDADFKKTGIPNPIKQDLFSKIIRKGFRTIESIKPINKRKVVLEPTFNFIPKVMDIRGDCYLSGVWQSEKYFTEFEAAIRKDFALKVPLSEKAAHVKRMMEASSSVSIHIRRGDQVKDPVLLKKHGELTKEYYSKALVYIQEKTGGTPIRIFVFSDEIDWVKENMNFGTDAVYVSEYKIPDYEELVVMSACTHHIIAKSSYSWWGAWLNPNNDKIVIAPKQRFGEASNVAHDLIPESWVQL